MLANLFIKALQIIYKLLSLYDFNNKKLTIYTIILLFNILFENII